MNTTVRKRVSVIVVHDGKILGFHAEDPHNGKKYFFLPGGAREHNESIEDTGKRETLEETGYTITIQAEPRIFRKYDFDWNGKIHDCETWYLTGCLQNNRPEVVNDASYHQGMGWKDIVDIESIFGYHKDIIEPIREILRLNGRDTV